MTLKVCFLFGNLSKLSEVTHFFSHVLHLISHTLALFGTCGTFRESTGKFRFENILSYRRKLKADDGPKGILASPEVFWFSNCIVFDFVYVRHF